MKALFVVGVLALAGCNAGTLQPPEPPDPPRQPVGGLPIALLAYSDDGTLLAVSRERIVRLDAGLNEIDRTAPPFPFDPEGPAPGLMYMNVFTRRSHVEP